ncbi:MAG TPA: ABC transporter substrate-binding protein [Candidatus Limnocylindria bacterium]|nr:ABC transporter substrate-binding protein [Candidatus Limnocylindria bacterium]
MTRPIKRALSVLALIGLMLGACGGGTAPAPSATATQAQGATQTASQAPSLVSDRKIQIGASASLTWLPLRVAVDRGFFKDAGLTNVSFTLIDSAPNAANALAAGEIDFAGLAFERAVLATAGGKPVQCVVSIQDTPPTSIVVPAKSDIKPGDWAALKGKTIGVVQGGWAEIVPKYFLQKNGIDLKDVKFTSTPNTAAQIAAIKSGQVDAVSGIEPSQRQAIFEGSAKMFFDLEDPAMLKQYWPTPFQATCLQVKADFAKANPAIMKAMQAAVARALKEIRANPAIAVDLAAKDSPTTDRAIFQQSVNALLNTWSQDGSLTEQAVANVSKLLTDYGVIKAPLPYADVVFTGK